jgi:hypothetical protein
VGVSVWAQKRGGELTLLSCYMDESADGENKVAFSVSAVVGTKAKWCWLEEQWQEILTKHNVKYFRNADCVGVDGAFKHFRKDPEKVTQEDQAITLAIRNELIDLCITSRVTAYGITIDLADFKAVANTPERLEAFGGTPYYHAAAWAIVRCAKYVREERPGDTIAFGFDEHQEYGAELQRVFKELKEKDTNLASQLVTIGPFDDKTFIPIQVADLFASMIRRFDFLGTPPKEFAPLEGKGIMAEILGCGKPCLEDHLRSVGKLDDPTVD